MEKKRKENKYEKIEKNNQVKVKGANQQIGRIKPTGPIPTVDLSSPTAN